MNKEIDYLIEDIWDRLESEAEFYFGIPNSITSDTKTAILNLTNKAKKNGFYMAMGLMNVPKEKVESYWELCLEKLEKELKDLTK